MLNIKDLIQLIRVAIYGRDVRSAIADSIENISDRQSVIDGQEQQRLTNETDRVSKETIRVSSENTRVSEWNTIKAQAVELANNANFKTFKYEEGLYTSTVNGTVNFTLNATTFNPFTDTVQLFNSKGERLIKGKNYSQNGSSITLINLSLAKDDFISWMTIAGASTFNPPGTNGGDLMLGSVAKNKLEATIQTTLDRFEGASMTSFETDTQLTKLEGCDDGFVKVELSGDTEVNLSKLTTVSNNSNDTLFYVSGIPDTKDRVITIINNTERDIAVDIAVDNAWERSVNILSNKVSTVIRLTNGEQISVIAGRRTNGWTDTNKNDLLKVMILDGEVKTPPNQYFEGMKHVGEPCAKENLFVKSTATIDSYPDYANGVVRAATGFYASDYIKIDPTKTYYKSYKNQYAFYDENKMYTHGDIGTNSDIVQPKSGDAYIRLTVGQTFFDNYTFGELAYKIEMSTETENLLDINAKVEASPLVPIPEQFKCKTHDGKLYIYTGASNYHGYGFKRWLNKGEYYLSSKNLTPSKSGYVVLNSDTAVSIQLKNAEQAVLYVPSDGWYYICFDMLGESSLTDPFILTDIMLTKGTDRKDYKPYDSNKTEILSSTPWRQWDTQNTDGTKTIGSGEVVLNGSENENWAIPSARQNTMRFVITMNLNSRNYNAISDKFKFLADDVLDSEHFYNEGNIIIFFINKSRLLTQDLAGFKTWLAANPITVAFQLATPITENTNKTLNLDAYPEGYLQINAGLIQPNANVTYATNIVGRIDSIEDVVEEVKGDVETLESAMHTMALETVDNGVYKNKAANVDGMDINELFVGGIYCGGNLKNAPTSEYFRIEVIPSSSGKDWCKQLISRLQNPYEEFHRVYDPNTKTWTVFVKFNYIYTKIPMGRPPVVEDGMVWLE